jgi:hypothetical protein
LPEEAYMAGWRNNMTLQNTDRALAILLFLQLLFTYSLFLQSPYNANIMSRIAVPLSLVHYGTLSIDKLQEFTIDKAYSHGRFYSDKAPGMAILAIPAVYITRCALKIIGQDGLVIKNGKLRHLTVYVYVSTVLTSGLLTALAAATFFLTARELGATQGGALFAALTYSFATPAFGWATAFFGHATAGASLFLAFAAGVALQRESACPRHQILLGCCMGGFLGLAIVVEFTTAPAAAVISLFALLIVIGLHHGQKWFVLCSAIISGVIIVTPLGVYNYLAFGSPLHLGYESVAGFPAMKQGFMGIGVPKLDILVKILFGRYRGLFTISPILLFAFWATIYTWYKGLLKHEHLICILSIVTSFTMINAGYYYWDGGWSIGPRFLTPMIVFLCLPLAVQWSRTGPILRSILVASFVVSAAISLAATSVGMDVSPDYQSPLTGFIIPNFLSGNLYASVFGVGLWPAWIVILPLIASWVLTALIAKLLLRRGSKADLHFAR